MARPLLLVALVAACAWSIRFLPGARSWIALAEAGHVSPLLLLLGGSLYCALGLPRQALGLACGLTCGAVPGMAVATAATLIGSALAYGAAALGFRAPLRGRALENASARGGHAPAQGRLAAWRDRLAARPFRSVLVLRLSPIGSALLVNIAAGAWRIGLMPFLAATLLGSAPQNLVFVMLGGGTRIGHGWQLGLAGLLAVVSLALGVALLRRAPTA